MDERNLRGDEPTPRLPRPAEGADEQRSEFAYDCSIARVARERTIFGQLEASASVAEVLKQMFASGHEDESAEAERESATRGSAPAEALPAQR